MNPVKINDTTYEVTLPRGDKVEIGDREAADFKPHLKLSRWEGESFIKVSLPTTAKRSPVIEEERVSWVEPDLEARFYPLEPAVIEGFTQNERGGFEFDVILKKKPPTNQIVLEIETQGLKFYYQPPLTPEEIAEGVARPENVVGSYAVYHATRTNMHASQADAEKYKCGKAFHIYRPKVIDAKGDWLWGELKIDEKAGTLTVTIEQDWLDKAVYPVLVDPTFGYEIKGSISYGSWDFDGSKFTALSNGTLTSISMYLKGSGNVNFGYFNDNSGAVGTHIAHGTAEGISGLDGWKTIAVSGSITSGNVYWLMAQQDATILDYYDQGDIGQEAYDSSYNFDVWINNPSVSYYGYKISVYATYTTGGGATEKTGSDTGTGADAKASGSPAAAVSGGESGSGAEALPGRDIALPEAGSGADAFVSLQTPAAKTASDTGWGVEAVSVPGVLLVGSDGGSGIEAFIARLLAAAETGSSAEASSIEGGGLLKHLFASELGEGADGLTAKIEKPNKGGGMRLWI